jgi:hypothetical protein
VEKVIFSSGYFFNAHGFTDLQIRFASSPEFAYMLRGRKCVRLNLSTIILVSPKPPGRRAAVAGFVNKLFMIRFRVPIHIILCAK